MELVETAEQAELRAIVRRALEENSSSAEVRRAMASGADYDKDLWRLISSELGLTGLLVPERFSGAGATTQDLAVVLAEMGRALVCAPYFATAVLGTLTLLYSGDDAATTAYLPGIADGSFTATLAGAGTNGDWSAGDGDLRAEETDEGWRLTGTRHYVLDGHVSDLTFAVADTLGGTSLFLVDGSPAGLTRTPLRTMDQTRGLATLDYAGVPARLIGEVGAGWPVVERVLDVAMAALAAEQVGGARRVLEMSVEHARTRIQFGVPIGSFQGIKHRCADMLIGVEMATSLAAYANWCAAQDHPDLPFASAMARSYCSDIFFDLACDNIQVHGGLGFTWEHDGHLYLKRAASARLLFGSPSAQRRTVASHLGL